MVLGNLEELRSRLERPPSNLGYANLSAFLQHPVNQLIDDRWCREHHLDHCGLLRICPDDKLGVAIDGSIG